MLLFIFKEETGVKTEFGYGIRNHYLLIEEDKAQ